MRKLSLAQVCFSSAWGGLEMNVFKMTKYFQDRGHNSFCICRQNSFLQKKLMEQNLVHLALNPVKYFSLLSSLKIRRFLKQERIQILHLHNASDLWTVYPALWKLPQTKLFLTNRIFFTRTTKKDFLHRKLYKRLTKLVALSQISKEQLARLLPVEENKIEVIPNGVDLEKFEPFKYDRNKIRKELSLDEKNILVGLIGRIDEGKGQKELILSAAEIVKNHPETKFLIVGHPTFENNYLPDLKNLVRELNLEKNIIFRDYSENIPEILSSLDIYVLPSYQETFSNSLLEAMAMEKPIIATDSGGTPEALNYGECGLLISPREVKPLAEALEKLIQNQFLAQKLSKAARQRAKSVYDIKRILERLESLYLQN